MTDKIVKESFLQASLARCEEEKTSQSDHYRPENRIKQKKMFLNISPVSDVRIEMESPSPTK